MSDIDGITALPRLLEKKRDLVVIMASTLTRRNAEVSLRALALGASRLHSQARKHPRGHRFDRVSPRIDRQDPRAGGATSTQRLCRPRGAVRTSGAAQTDRRPRRCPTRLRRVHGTRYRAGRRLRRASQVAAVSDGAAAHALLIGSSTGGPQALNVLVGAHRPASSIRLRSWSPSTCRRPSRPSWPSISRAPADGRRAKPMDGEAVRPGRIYVAPGGRHMRVVRQDGSRSIALDDGPQINFCKPAVDPMFSSAAETWGCWPWPWCSPAWAPTARTAPPTSWPPAAA